MPPPNEPANQRALRDVVEQMDRYPLEAFQFVQQGLSYSVEKFHAGLTDPTIRRHISGQQLCDG
ncbi:MAG TPA: hypothetical protein VKK61_06885, partial [Tepidisphaeraceae bacterium]|nr:hypothetical protein [Tepidisphaeraceae bacterium]